MWLVSFINFIIKYLNRLFMIDDTLVCKFYVIKHVVPVALLF